MILPSKHLSEERALLTIGATILRRLVNPMTPSAMWEKIRRACEQGEISAPVRFDTWILALDLLFIIGAIELRDGLLIRSQR